jgi:hypothetical protein
MEETTPLTSPVYLTRYWETRGILKFEPGERAHFYTSDSGTRYFVYQDLESHVRLFVSPKDYFTDLDRAQDRIRTMARRRLKALAKKVEKLDAVAMNGVKVVDFEEAAK